MSKSGLLPEQYLRHPCGEDDVKAIGREKAQGEENDAEAKGAAPWEAFGPWAPRRLAPLHCADTYGSLPLGWDWALTMDIPDPLMRAPSREEGLSSHAPQSKPEPPPPCADTTTGLVNLRRKSRLRRRCPRGTRRACHKIRARCPVKSVVNIPRAKYRGGHLEVPPSTMAGHPRIDVDPRTIRKNEWGKTEPPN